MNKDTKQTDDGRGLLFLVMALSALLGEVVFLVGGWPAVLTLFGGSAVALGIIVLHDRIKYGKF